MRDTPLLLCLGAFAACFGAPGLSAAEDNCSGHYVSVGARSISISNDPTEPSHILIGECHEGVCIRKDGDGDEMTLQTARTPGEYLASWRVISGTGKYVNTKRSGWYKQTRVDGDVVVGEWGGNCQ
jgi:hypothetical protein